VNFLRRIYLLLLGLLLVIMVTLLLLSPQAVGGWVGSISELSPVIRLAVTIVIDLFLLLLMYLQVRPDPGAKVNGLVMRGSGAITEVSVESARDRILKAVSDVPDVVSVEADVKPVRGRAEIEMQVAVFGHDVKLPAKQKEIDRALRQVIDKQLGLQMAGQPRIQLRIHGEPEPKPPVIAAPPPVVIIEKETPPIQPLPAEKVETVPDVKPSTGLFGGLGRTEEPKPVDMKPLPSYDEPIVVKAEPKPEPASGGFFSGWGRGRDDDEKVLDTPVKPEVDIEDLPSPSLSSLMSSETAAVVEAEDDSDKDEVVVELDNKAVKFDLDEELSYSDMDDFVDDEPETDDIVIDDEIADADKQDRNPL
jgi:hypothetical protein